MKKTLPETIWKMKIKRDDDIEYTAYPIFAVDDSTTKPGINMGIAGTVYHKNPLMALEGQVKEVPFEFAIWDDGRDRANGTVKENDTVVEVVTVEEQIDFLTDVLKGDKIDEYFFSPGFSVEYDVEIYHGEGEDKKKRMVQTCIIENVDVPILSSGSWKFITGCRMDLVMGDPI